MNISLNIKTEALTVFYQLLEQGFIHDASPGCSARSLICNQLGLHPQYLEEKVQTVFLDHKPVDNLDSAILQEGSILALSAAMPGLAGATLRKGGCFAALRKQISCDIQDDRHSEEKTQVTVKYFNLIARELGQAFLEKGVRIKGANLNGFFKKHFEDLQPKITSIQLDGKNIDPNAFSQMRWHGEVFLKVGVG
jgi:hypothetical protein